MSGRSADRVADRVLVVGTAGHVDHGKSALVLALTGTDPDRLAEEKARGLTIDLGFAWTQLPDGHVVNFVDVPGHEDFVRNMLAGAGGVDAVVLVVAADEGPMPQTREHLAILDLLSVDAAVVAVTKCDLVDEEWLQLVEEEVVELLLGTSLEGAPVLPVSATRGTGLDRLRDALGTMAARVPAAPDRGRARLSVDRCFSLSGFGTVVTGTLRDGTIAEGAVLDLLPSGRRCRARSLQSRGSSVDLARPGTRTAINLSGIAADEVERGDVIAEPGHYRATRLLDTHLRVLPDASAPLRHDALLTLFLGAAEVQAHARVIGRREIAPGQEGPVQLRLKSQVAPCAGDRFVLRQPSPARTIGGGTILDPHPRSRWRRFRSTTLERFAALASGDRDEVAWHMLAQHEPCPPSALEPVQTGLPPDERDAALAALARTGRAVSLGPLWMTGTGWASLSERLRQTLRSYHEAHPLRAGMAAEELRERVALAADAFAAACARAADEGWLVREGALVRAASHDVRFDTRQQEKTAALLARFDSAPYRPPSVKEAEADVGPEILASLLGRGELVAVGGDVLFRPKAYHAMREAVLAHLADHGQVTVADVRDRFDTSRRYALALLEHLDRTRVTRRMGDAHVLAARAGEGGAASP